MAKDITNAKVARTGRMKGQWCRLGLERKGWPNNYSTAKSLGLAGNTSEVWEGFKHSSDR